MKPDTRPSSPTVSQSDYLQSDYRCDLLAFAPHPDDVEMCCGGLVAKMSALGHRVGIVDLTRGELGSRGSVEKRIEEAENARRALNVAFRINACLPDGGIDASGQSMLPETGLSQLECIVQILRIERPRIVLIPPPQDRHPDHGAAHELLSKALFFCSNRRFGPNLGRPFTCIQSAIYAMRFAFKPSFIVDITDHLEAKWAAIRAHASQLGLDTNEGQDIAPTLAASPLSLSSVEAKDRYYGAMIGTPAGEPYMTWNVPHISDPVTHFSEYPVSGSLFFPQL